MVFGPIGLGFALSKAFSGGKGGGPGGSIANAPGAWNALFQQLQGSEGPGAGMFANILERFPPQSGRNIQRWFAEAAPLLAGTLFQSPGYKYAQDPANWDRSMEAYGAGAGILGRQAQQGLSQGGQQLARMGLGRSGAQAALANQTTQTLAGQQANLFSNLFQQSVQNRLAGAQQAFDLDQAIMRLALGHTQMPPQRQQSPGLGGLIATTLGSALGMGFGGLIGGPAGAAAAGVQRFASPGVGYGT